MSRASLIKLVHTGCRHAFPDERSRKDWQQDRTGHRSCADMSEAALEKLVAELRHKGALKPPKRAGRVPFNRSAYMDKIEAQLADMGLSWQYAESIAWRITGGQGLQPQSQPGVRRLEWVRQQKHFVAIIGALHVEQEKRALMANINDALAQLGKDFAYIDSLVPDAMRGIKWQRKRSLLKSINHRLQYDLNNQENHRVDQ